MVVAEPAPRSINSKLLQEVVAKGEGATLKALQQFGRNECSCPNEMTEHALRNLVRDGFLTLSPAGIYAMKPRAEAHERRDRVVTVRAPAAKPAVTPQLPAPQAAAATILPADEIVCNECNQPKPASDFYAGNRKCKPCYLARQKAQAKAREAGITMPRSPTKPAARVAPPAVHSEAPAPNHPTTPMAPQPAPPPPAPVTVLEPGAVENDFCFVREEVHGVYCNIDGDRVSVYRSVDAGADRIRMTRKRALELARWMIARLEVSP
jgi:hypothetical protein